MIGRLEWENRPRAYPDDIPILGVSSDLERIYDQTPFDKLLVVGGGLPSEDDTASRESLIRALNFCEEKNISYYMVPDFLDVAVMQVSEFCWRSAVSFRILCLPGGRHCQARNGRWDFRRDAGFRTSELADNGTTHQTDQ